MDLSQEELVGYLVEDCEDWGIQGKSATRF
jgi:hypothetical protein